MKLRPVIIALLATSWTVFAVAMVWPTIALVGRCVVEGVPPYGGYALSSRQLNLAWRSVWLSVATVVLCLVVSLPGAFWMGRVRRLSYRWVAAALLLGLLLCPPMVYAFGWERILPVSFNAYARCIGVWALWAWSIPALMIGTGWSRVGRGAYEAALIVTSPTSAFIRAALPLLLRYVALSGLILFVLYFSDYSVPHACLLRVYATELLGWAASSARTVDTAWPSLPSVLVTGVALSGVFFAWRGCAADDDNVEGSGTTTPSPSHALTGTVLACLAVSWLLPISALVARLASWTIIVEALETYGRDLAWSLGVAIISAAAAVCMGLGLVVLPRVRTAGLIWAVAFGALPGALIGEALVAAYNYDVTWWVYDHWPIVALSYVARFGWIGILAALLAMASTPPELVAQARLDGANRQSILARIQIPMNLPMLLCGVGVIVALALADVGATSLIRVPSFNPVADILVEKFHRFEDGMLISLSLCLVSATLPPALLAAAALRSRAGR